MINRESCTKCLPPVIRPAVPADVDGLTGLLRVLSALETDFVFEEEKRRRGLQMMLANEHARLLVAEAGGMVIGMCAGQVTVSSDGRSNLLIQELAVHRAWRGKGVDRCLLAAAIEWGERQGVSCLQLMAGLDSGVLSLASELDRRTAGLMTRRKPE
jgi:GNAT superfamily N-acetyltransferase